MSSSIFISHAVRDVTKAEAVVRYLTDGLGVPRKEIFCSSISDIGIPNGERFVEYIVNQLNGSQHVIALLTKNYFDSDFCKQEIGAAVSKGNVLFCILFPPLEFSDLTAMLDGLQVTLATDSKLPGELAQRLSFSAASKRSGPEQVIIAGQKLLDQLEPKTIPRRAPESRPLTSQNAEIFAPPKKLSEVHESEKNLSVRFVQNVWLASEQLRRTTGQEVKHFLLCDYYEKPYVIRSYAHEPQFQTAVGYGYLHLESGPIIKRSHPLICEIHDALSRVDRDFIEFGSDWAESLDLGASISPSNLEFWEKHYFL